MAINDPESGVVFEPAGNYICLKFRYPLYHCPFCGGMFPDSSQPLWVPIVPQEEFTRVEQLVVDLTDPEAIISRLGPADYDSMTRSYTPPVRNIEYYGYSDWLAIEFYIPAGEPARHHLSIKPLSAKHRVSAEPAAAPDRDGA